MKRMILFVLVFMLTLAFRPSCSAEAAGAVILEEEGLSVTVRSAAAEPDRLRLNLSCVSLRAEEGGTLQFLVPAVNGTDTVFGSGWPGEDWTLSLNGEARGELTLLLPEGASPPYMLTLRFSFGGLLSTPASVPVPDTAAAVPASFSGEEPQVLSPDVASDSAVPAETLRVEDSLPPEMLSGLEVSLAWFCLRTEDGLFVPFSSVPLSVGPDGAGSAVSRGTALFLDGAEEYPLCFRETEQSGAPLFRPDALSLVGEAVYFASLDYGIVQTGDGFALSEPSLYAAELGGLFHTAPLALFDAAQPLFTLYAWTGGALRTERTLVPSVPLDRSLTLRLVSAASLGEVWAVCEYDFSDGSQVFHDPVLLTGR